MSLRSVIRITGVLLGVAPVIAGCHWILGFEEPKLRQAPGEGGSGGVACSSPADCPGADHASATCEEGTCGLQCDDGFDDCDEVEGCETATKADKSNCGGCGTTCSAYCIESSCNDPIDIAAGPSHACAVLKDGTVWCWGAIPSVLPVATRAHPTQVPLQTPAIQVRAGGFSLGPPDGCFIGHTCVLLSNKTVQCWGCNDYGQLGVGSTTFIDSPAQLGLLTNVKEITAGGAHTCAVDSEDQLFCWGRNNAGQLGNGTMTDALSPVMNPMLMAAVTAGWAHTCGVTPAGSVMCWGLNSEGQVGEGSLSNQLLPKTVLLGGIDVACGSLHTCARDAFGSYCWGSNDQGQLGIGSNVDQSTPQPLDLPGVEALALGRSHSGGLVNGALYTWGDNAYGQLGNGTPLATQVPTEVGLNSVEKFAAGDRFSCVLTKTQAVLCWGDNSYGQLGNGSRVGASSPTHLVWP